MINFKYSDLCNLLGQDVPQETLVQRIPMIGADMHDTEPGCEDMGVEFFPDRPDLYSVEGLARALRAFLDIDPGMKKYEVKDGDVEVTVDQSVKSLRPWFLCGVVRNVEIDDEFLRSMMELQEKLHITIGRKRSKLAIGIHDLNKVEPPFVYKLVDPHSVRFVPLAMDQEMDLAEILEKNEKGRAYARLLDNYDMYPIIQDRNGSVLSFPPIINGVLTTVTVGRHDLFIDVTGNDRKAVKGALDIVATALAERGGTIETVIMHDGSETFRSPDLTPSKRTFSASACDRFLGTTLGPEGMVECLRRMGMDAVADGDEVEVTIPSVRLDIMHDVDIYEDVATGYGFERFGGKHKLDQTSGSLSHAQPDQDPQTQQAQGPPPEDIRDRQRREGRTHTAPSLRHGHSLQDLVHRDQIAHGVCTQGDVSEVHHRTLRPPHIRAGKGCEGHAGREGDRDLRRDGPVRGRSL